MNLPAIKKSIRNLKNSAACLLDDKKVMSAQRTCKYRECLHNGCMLNLKRFKRKNKITNSKNIKTIRFK